MGEIAIFSFGSVMFILTTWATFNFGLRQIRERYGRLPETDATASAYSAPAEASGQLATVTSLPAGPPERTQSLR